MAKHSTLPSLSRALALIVCACAVPALIAAIWAINYHYDETREQISASAVRRVTSIAANIDSVVTGVEIGLLTLRQSAHLEHRDLGRFHSQATIVLDSLGGARNIYLTDSRGQQLVNTLKPYGSKLPVTGNITLVEKVVRTGRTQVSGVFQGAVAGVHLVAVGVPVKEEGKVVAVLAATLRPEGLTALLHKQYLPNEWIISIYDRDDRFIARSHDVQRFVGEPASDEMRRVLAARESGTFEGSTRDGVAVFAAFTRAPHSGWSVVVGIPRSALMDELNRNIWAALLAILVTLATGWAAATYLAGRIRRDILAIIPAAEALSRSEPMEMVTSFAETQAVAAALRRAAERLRQSEHAAMHDALTGLPNRSLMHSVLPGYKHLAQRRGTSFSVLVIDLDGFKQVNDDLGHHAGDAVLCQAAQRISACIRASDMCVRLGGDEFAVMLQDLDCADAMGVSRKIIDALCDPVATEAGQATVSASIGVACFPDDAHDVETLLLKADMAMYQAKRNGKRQVISAGLLPEAALGAA